MLNHQESRNSLNKLVHLLTVVIVATFLMSSPSLAEPNATVNLSESGISATGASFITFMQLRVADPDGQIIFDQSTDGSPISWIPSEKTSDGFYSYEVRLGKAAKKENRDSNNSRGVEPKTKAMLEAGNFLIKNGSIVLQSEKETGMLNKILSISSFALQGMMDFFVSPAVAADVHTMDVSVQGSLCVGLDCVNGESFGFDTIRLKENTLRIKFEDTSTSASFPTNDWQITVNDSSNGGANKFSIDDIDGGKTPFTIIAGAPTNSLYVASSGRIGLGTSTPTVELHMVDGDTPTLRLEQDGSSGFTPQTFDIAANEANFFIRDVTNGSKLTFRIKPGAPEDSIYVNNNGNIGLGTNSPTASLHIRETSATETTLLKVATSSDEIFKVQRDGSVGIGTDLPEAALHLLKAIDPATVLPDDPPILFNLATKNTTDSSITQVFKIASTGDALLLGNLELGSSRSYKENIYALNSEEARSALEDLSPVHFNYRSSPGVNAIGFIAEDVPDLVASKDRKSLRPMDIIAVLTKVTQEQQKSIEQLSETIARLQEKIDNDSNNSTAITLQ